MGGTVSGGAANHAGNGSGSVVDAWFASVGGGRSNLARNNYSTVGGGLSNEATGDYATVSGGNNNTASEFTTTIGGGQDNKASEQFATVSGGLNNTASGDQSGFATVGGGVDNIADGRAAAISGGDFNHASGRYAAIPGGRFNTAAGNGSFAAGQNAKANHDGAFVWADGANGDFLSSAANQFSVRATGGVRIYTNPFLIAGVILPAGDNAWSPASDRNTKQNFRDINPEDILEHLAAIPITTWNYKTRDDIRHIGPMAQDFFAAFGGLGIDDKHISTIDADGVAFAAIQGLYRRSVEQQKQLEAIQGQMEALKCVQAENVLLKQQLAELSETVRQLKAAQEELRANQTGHK